MKAPLLLALGGIAGTLARYYLGMAVTWRWGAVFPFATLLINVSGCFAIGLLATLAAERAQLITPELRWLLIVGFCGAYTTFSTFGLETLVLIREGAWLKATLYVFASNGLGLLATFGGFWCARALP